MPPRDTARRDRRERRPVGWPVRCKALKFVSAGPRTSFGVLAGQRRSDFPVRGVGTPRWRSVHHRPAESM